MAVNKIYVGLDIGTSKTCMVVGEVKPDATLTILGVSQVPTHGVIKGQVQKPAEVTQCVYEAWNLAQEQADVDIVSVYMSIAGRHIVGVPNKGTYRLPDGETHITQEIIDELTKRAHDLPLGSDQFLLHRINGLYTIDSQENLSNPLGLEGRTIDLNCHIIHGTKSVISNMYQCVREVPLDVNDVVFSPIATAQHVISRAHKQAGTLLIDIGAGTTDYVLYMGGQLVRAGSIPVGGDHLTNDIHLLCGVPLEDAEKLKISEGDAFYTGGKSDDMARLLGPDNEVLVEVPRNHLNETIQTRLVDLFEQLKAQLPAETFRHRNCSQVMLCGGSSMMRGMGQLASNMFGVTTSAPSQSVKGEVPSYLADPRYFTAIGLVRYAQILEAVPNRDNALTRFIKSFLHRGK